MVDAETRRCGFWTLGLASILFFVGLICYGFGAQKAAIYLWLIFLVIWFLVFGVFAASEPAALSTPAGGWFVCAGCSCFLFLIVMSIVALVAAYTSGDEVNYFQVSRVDLTKFDFGDTSSTTLNYHLAVIMGPNPNKVRGRGRGEVYYEDVKAWAYYQGQAFTSLTLSQPGEYLGADKDSSGYFNSSSGTLHLVFQGQDKLVLPSDGLNQFQLDAAAGRFSIALTLSYVQIKETGYSDLTKGVVTFELKDVPLSKVNAADNSTTFINGGWVAGDAVAV